MDGGRIRGVRQKGRKKERENCGEESGGRESKSSGAKRE